MDNAVTAIAWTDEEAEALAIQPAKEPTSVIINQPVKFLYSKEIFYHSHDYYSLDFQL